MIPMTIGYRDVERGMNDFSVASEQRPTPEERELIFGIVKRWLAKELEPFRTVNVGNKSAALRLTNERVERFDPDNPTRILYASKEVPLELRHVTAAKLCTRSDQNLEYDPETGDPVTPYVHVVCWDGSQADVEVPKDLVKRVPKSKSPKE